MDYNIYLGFGDKPFDEAFDLVMQGMPTVAILIAERVVRFADAGMEIDADEVSGCKKLSASLGEWAEWTDRGVRQPLRGEDEEYLEHLTSEASKVCIEAWRELSVRAMTRKMLAEDGWKYGMIRQDAAGEEPAAEAA